MVEDVHWLRLSFVQRSLIVTHVFFKGNDRSSRAYGIVSISIFASTSSLMFTRFSKGYSRHSYS